MLPSRFSALAIVTLVAAGALRSAAIHAQGPAATSRQLAPARQSRVSLTWQGQQLGPALDRLSEAQHTAIWLDRRIDPSTLLDYTASDRSLLEALNELGSPHGWAAAPYAGVIYFGPKKSVEELATVAALAREPLAKMPAPSRARWLKAQAWSFPRLSEPRALVRDVVKATGAAIQGDELIPHDLWTARKLPAMAAIDRLVLALSGFDLTCELAADGEGVRIVPIKRPALVSREYAVPRDRASAVESLLKEMPQAAVERRGQRVKVAARIEEHEQIAAALRGQSRPSPGSPRPSRPNLSKPADRRFTLKIENKPVGPVVDQLAKQLSLEVTWDPRASANAGRDALISSDVREVDLDALLRAVLTPAKLAFKRDGQKITIRGAE